MRPVVELPDLGIRQSTFRVQVHVPREWHLVIPHLGSQPGQDLHLTIGGVITPAGKIHIGSGPEYIIFYEPRHRRQVTIPRPASAVGVTILTGTLQNSSKFWCRLRACQQRLIRTLSLNSPKRMNKGGGEAQQTDGRYTRFEDGFHDYLRSSSQAPVRNGSPYRSELVNTAGRLTALYFTILLNASLYSRMRQCQFRSATATCPSREYSRARGEPGSRRSSEARRRPESG
jgi:hypothetical protein